MASLSGLKTRAFLNAKKALQSLRPGQRGGSGRVVFVGGVQRSGTTMVMTALDRSWDTDVFPETDPRAFDSFFMRDLEVIQRLHRESRFPFFVLKSLLEGHRVAELKTKFPGSKAVWLYRNYADMVNSHIVKWPGGREQIDDVVKDPNSAAYRGRGMTQETLDFVRGHFRPEMNDASALALFWCYRNQLLFDQGLEKDPDTLVLRYESLVTEPAATFRRLCDHIGLDYSPNLHALIHARSISKQAAPEIDPAIEEHCRVMFARLEEAAG